MDVVDLDVLVQHYRRVETSVVRQNSAEKERDAGAGESKHDPESGTKQTGSRCHDVFGIGKKETNLTNGYRAEKDLVDTSEKRRNGTGNRTREQPDSWLR